LILIKSFGDLPAVSNFLISELDLSRGFIGGFLNLVGSGLEQLGSSLGGLASAIVRLVALGRFSGLHHNRWLVVFDLSRLFALFSFFICQKHLIDSLLFCLGFLMLLNLVVKGANAGDDENNEPEEPTAKHWVVKCAVLE